MRVEFRTTTTSDTVTDREFNIEASAEELSSFSSGITALQEVLSSSDSEPLGILSLLTDMVKGWLRW